LASKAKNLCISELCPRTGGGQYFLGRLSHAALRSGKTLKSCVDIVRGLMRTCRMTLALVGYSYQRDSWQLGRQLLNI